MADLLLLRTTSVVLDCEQFLGACNGAGTPVESYLVQHSLVVLCADIQQEIYKIAENRACLASDRQLAHFVSSASRRVLRSVKKDELAVFVGFFGVKAKERFNGMLDDIHVTTYNNAVSNRHDVAHRGGVNVTFRELKLALEAASTIISALRESIEYVESDFAN